MEDQRIQELVRLLTEHRITQKEFQERLNKILEEAADQANRSSVQESVASQQLKSFADPERLKKILDEAADEARRSVAQESVAKQRIQSIADKARRF